MTRWGVWGGRGLIGASLLRATGFEPLDDELERADLDNFFAIVNCRESSSKRLALEDPTQFLKESVDKSRLLYRAINRHKFVKVVFFSTLDCDESGYVMAKKESELLLSEWLPKSRFKIIRVPGVVGIGLRKGPIYDIIHGNIFERRNLLLNFIDVKAIVEFLYYLESHWHVLGSEINLRPRTPVSLFHIWNLVHSRCSCLENPYSLKTPISIEQFPASLLVPSLDESSVYLRRFLSDGNMLCSK